MIEELKTGLTFQDVDFVRNEVKHIINAPDPDQYPIRNNMKYFLDLEMPEFAMSSSFARVLRLEGREKPPITTGGISVYEGCNFRLEELLAGRLSLTLPERNNTLLSSVVSLTTRYRVREIVEPAIRDQYLSPRYAIRAGLALRDFVGYQHTFFSRSQASKRQFLTWQPTRKTVGAKQREYLYFLLNFTPLPSSVRLRVRYTTALATSTAYTKATITGLQAFQVVCAQAGPLQLQIPVDALSYEVWLADQDNKRLTEVRTYKLDQHQRLSDRHILFSNSFGGFDTLRLVGHAAEQVDVFRTTAKRERETGKGLEFSELHTISISAKSGIKVHTGFFRDDATTYLDYLQELMQAESILLETPYGFEALALENTNLEYKSDDPGLISRSFIFSRTHAEKNYSRLDPVAPAPARATKWVGVSTRTELDANGKRTGYLMFERLRKVYTDDNSPVIPYVMKPNIPGDPDYIAKRLESSIVIGSTPYPNDEISRPSTFRRNDCEVGELGTYPEITISEGQFGGEMPGDANYLAELAWLALNTQEYANNEGTCELNNVPIDYAIFHKIPMDPDLKVSGNGDYGPVVDLRLDGSVIITNTSGAAIPEIRLSPDKHMPGIVDLVMQVTYNNFPFYPCKLRVVGKPVEITVTSPGFYQFQDLQVNTADEPLTIEVVQL